MLINGFEVSAEVIGIGLEVCDCGGDSFRRVEFGGHEEVDIGIVMASEGLIDLVD